MTIYRARKNIHIHFKSFLELIKTILDLGQASNFKVKSSQIVIRKLFVHLLHLSASWLFCSFPRGTGIWLLLEPKCWPNSQVVLFSSKIAVFQWITLSDWADRSEPPFTHFCVLALMQTFWHRRQSSLSKEMGFIWANVDIYCVRVYICIYHLK